jgi:hypothetical protein
MDLGELLTRWTVRLALLLYLISLVMRAGSHPRSAWVRLLWTAGCLVFLLHVACAFHFCYLWSHAIAYAATAQRTAEVVGLDWGGGLYANYAFTLLWAVDVCWWWYASDHYRVRPRAVDWGVQGFMGFMAFNGVVVFGAGAVRWLGLGASLLLAGRWSCRMCRAEKN